MRLSTIASLLAALAVAINAKPVIRKAASHVVHEERTVLPRSWTRGTRAHPSAPLPVRIGLTQQNLHRVEDYVLAVSHPNSPDYGKHWSPERVIDTFAPRKEAIDSVTEWLEAQGIEKSRVRLSRGRNWLTFDAYVGELEQLLETEYYSYQHARSGHSHIACQKYHIPAHLVEHIDIITPTLHFDTHTGPDRISNKTPLSKPQLEELTKRVAAPTKRQAPGIQGVGADSFSPKQGIALANALATLQNCDQMITPDCLRALYSIPEGTLANSNNTLGVVEYTPQAFLQSDLDLFFSQFPSSSGSSSKSTGSAIEPLVKLIDGAVVQKTNQTFDLNGESALDLEYALSLIVPQRTTLFQVGDQARGASFNNLLSALDASYCSFQGGNSKDPALDGQYPEAIACGTAEATNVISTSYGANEADFVFEGSTRYVERQCSEYAKLALRGVTVVYSSGDDGVAGNQGECLSSTSSAVNSGGGAFSPTFPSTCPYVLSVGATQILNGSSVADPESACEEVIFSGGGFSNVFAVPAWQRDAVAEWFDTGAPNLGADRYNNSGRVRAYPDISANGARYVTAVDGKFGVVFGTSASAPVVASIINLINEQRLAAGKGPVGFVNPVLYQHPEVLNDITKGNNPGCGTEGFSAVEGWDPVTGLGTPNFPKMLDLFMSLP